MTPRALLDMASKDRAKLLPSLDKVAGLRGKQRQPDAWSWRAEHDRDPSMAALLEALKRWAREGGEPSQNATKIEHLARQNRYMTTDGQEISILDSQGRLRHKVTWAADVTPETKGGQPGNDRAPEQPAAPKGTTPSLPGRPP